MGSWLGERLGALREKGLYRFLRTVEGDQGPSVTVDGKRLLNFSSNNYLGLANHPRLKAAAIRATERYGTSSGASRLITGSMDLHRELEETLAHFKGVESVLLFNSGYQANTGAIAALAGEGDRVFSDALNHASLIDGCRLSKAKTEVYRHNDLGHLEDLLKTASGGRKLIIADTVFSMDGDLCPLPGLLSLAERYDAWIYLDEAHATGVFGAKGRGVVEHFGITSDHPRLLQMGTLGKALGSFGAYIAGSKELSEYLINRARTFIYSTSLPPAVCAAAIEAIRIVEETPDLRLRLWKNVAYFAKRLGQASPSPIFPVIIGNAQETMTISQRLFEKGIWAQGIRPPTVAEGTSRIRFTLMATHSREHLDRCLEVLNECR